MISTTFTAIIEPFPGRMSAFDEKVLARIADGGEGGGRARINGAVADSAKGGRASFRLLERNHATGVEGAEVQRVFAQSTRRLRKPTKARQAIVRPSHAGRQMKGVGKLSSCGGNVVDRSPLLPAWET